MVHKDFYLYNIFMLLEHFMFTSIVTLINQQSRGSDNHVDVLAL